LGEGDKAKITLRFRGREITHQEFGLALLRRVEADLQEHAVVEQFPKMEGRQMVMVLAPKKVEKIVPKAPKVAKPAEKVAEKIEEKAAAAE
jgi:translation initiation factor IF-3